MNKLVPLVLVLLVAAIRAQDGPAPAPTVGQQEKKVEAAEVESLVTRLADRDFAVREKADSDLRALGRAALPFIEKHLNDEDAEVRMRLKAIVESLRASASPAVEEPGPKPLRPIRPGRRLEVEDQDGDVRIDIDVAPVPRPRRSDFDSDDDFRRAIIRWREDTNDRARSRAFAGPPGIGQSIVIGPGGASFRSNKTIYQNGDRLSLTQGDQGIRFELRPKGGELQVAEAPDLESFKKEHADLYERYKGTGIFEQQSFRFEVLRPDAPQSELSERERATRERLERLLDLTREDPFADFDERFRELMRRNEEMNRSLRERLDSLFGSRDHDDLFGQAEELRRRRALASRREGKTRLGVLVARPPAAVAATLDREKLGATGVWVSEVTRGSLADEIGIEPGDVLLRLGTTALDQPEDLVRAFEAIGPGEKISIGLRRGAESLTLSGLKPGERKPDAEAEPKKLQKIPERDVKKF